MSAFLCAQPILWVNGTVLAQGLERNDVFGTAAPQVQPEPQFPGDAERHPAFPQQGDGYQPGPDFAPSLKSALLDEPLDPEAYVCGPGDVLELNLWGLRDLRFRVTINAEGRAFIPRLGSFDFRGKKLADVRRIIGAAVQRVYPRLDFDLSLVQPRTFMVQVVGAAQHPASYPARATDRVATVIAQAGGFEKGSSWRRIEIRHRDGTVQSADLLRFVITGDVRFNPHVLDGDAIRIPYEELAASIAGGVNRPGRYELTGARDLAELVELAGGLSPHATNELPLTLVRWSMAIRQEQVLLSFDTDGALPVLRLEAQDEVLVPTRADLQQSVYVVGAFSGALPQGTGASGRNPSAPAVSTAPDEASATRRIPFVKGETVRRLLDRVGGVGPLADLTRAYVIRGGGTIPVDLERLIVLRDLSVDREIVLGDTLVVPFRRSNIVVEGAVFAPGSYPYNPTFKIDQYLALAGGTNRNAQDVMKVRIVTPAGEMRPYNKELVVEPGSSVVVPERHFSRGEVVQIVLAAASLAISGVAVMIAAKK